MKALFCDLGLHLWGDLDFARDLIECDLCGHQVLAEDASRRGNSLPPMRTANGTRPDWLRRPVFQTRVRATDRMPSHGGIWTRAELEDALNTFTADPVPSLLRVGPGVTDYLRLAAGPANPFPGSSFPLGGVPIVPTDGYRTGEWRAFDQHGNEIGAGQIEALSGMPAGVQVITSPHLPPGVAAVAYAPTTLRPDDPDYPLYGLHAVVLRDDHTDPE